MKVVGVVENMSELVLPDGTRYPVFGEGGGDALAREIGAPLVARIPLEPAVAAGGDRGEPVARVNDGGPAATAFQDLAARLATELIPPVEMAGCTARMLDLLEQVER